MREGWGVRLPIAGGWLRPWRVDDAVWYMALRDEEVFRWTTERRDLTRAEMVDAIRRVNASDEVSSWAITDKTGDTPLGNLALVYDATAACVEAMYFLGAAGRGRGLATAALTTACQWAFANLPIALSRAFCSRSGTAIYAHSAWQRAPGSYACSDLMTRRRCGSNWRGHDCA